MIRTVIDWLLWKLHIKKGRGVAELTEAMAKQVVGVMAFAVVRNVAGKIMEKEEREYQKFLKGLHWHQRLCCRVLDWFYDTRKNLPKRIWATVVGY